MSTLAPRERRLIALGILAAVFALLWLIVARPILGGFADRGQRRQDLLQTYTRGERVIGAMRITRAAARAQRATMRQYAIDAPGQPFAIDLLRERVAVAARANHVTVGSVQEAPAPSGFVGVDVRLTMQLDKLGAFVAALENGSPLLIVDQLGIAADQAATSGHAAPVEVKLDLSARYDAPRGAGPTNAAR